MPAAALRTLLSELIDYAGLFPPAGLPLAEAASNYGSYLRSPDAWALGRLVIPAGQLAELSALVPHGACWRVSALLAGDADAGIRAVRENNAMTNGTVHVDSVEARVPDRDEIARLAEALGTAVVLYAEIPRERAAELLVAVRGAGARAKIRTGGITPEVFPDTREVAEFVVACVAADVPFKATAGLHHPLRGSHPLTYEAGAACGSMHGFLNVFLAAAFARQGMDAATVARLLDDGDATHFRFSDDEAEWAGHRTSNEELRAARQCAAIAFGSCSFREPLDDLSTLGLL